MLVCVYIRVIITYKNPVSFLGKMQ